MANEQLLKFGTPILWADATDWVDDNHGWGADTDQLDLTGVLAAAARQGASADFLIEASASRHAPLYVMRAAVEIASLAASGEVIDYYLAYSDDDATFPGGVSGTDGAYTGTSGDSLDDSLVQLTYIGSLRTTADNTTAVQIQTIGYFIPEARYAAPVVVNGSAGALFTDAIEMGIYVKPLIGEIQ